MQVSYQTVAVVSGTALSQNVTKKAYFEALISFVVSVDS